MFSTLRYKHRYPACWRCKTELVWKVADEWYIAMDRVETGSIDGKEFIVNCPCNGLRPYEDGIWKHRHIIAKYVAARTKKIAEEAYSDEAEAEALQEGIESDERHLKFVKCSDCGGYFPDELLKAYQGELYCERCVEKNRYDLVVPVQKVVVPLSEALGFPQKPDDSDNLPF